MIIGNPRSTLVAFTVGEKYQPGGEFKVLKKRNKDSVCSGAVQFTLQGLEQFKLNPPR